jgi:acetylglutamate kinase
MVQRLIEKAAVLVEALPYIQAFKDRIVVVKFGGSLMDNDQYVNSIMRDVVFMHSVGMKPVVVHGGGGLISEEMRRAGLTPRFVEGYRVTDADTITLVERVLGQEVNAMLQAKVREFGAVPEGHSGRDFGIVQVSKLDPAVSKKAGAAAVAVDIGFVGTVEKIDAGPILSILDSGRLPVIASLGRGTDGATYNVNADETASEMAVALQAEKLVFLTDVGSLLRNAGDPESLISTLTVSDAKELLKSKAASGGMIPKLRGCIKAVRHGVHKTHIIDGRLTHSLLLEIFTDKGVGTQLVP